MKKTKKGAPIEIHRGENGTLIHAVYGAVVAVKDSDGKYQSKPVEAELTIDYSDLRLLVQKAYGNKSRRSSVGPLTIRITKGPLP